MNVLLVTSDLMVQSRVTAAAARVGISAPRIMGSQDVQLLDEDTCFDRVLLDLSAPGMDVASVVPVLRERLQEMWIVAFGPHVQTGKLAAAREAGCDLVISRGQLERDVDRLLGSPAP